jgi:blue copper oxidase
MMNRRKFVRSTTLGIGGVSLYAAGDFSGLVQALAVSIDIDPFRRPFFVPPVEEGERNGNQLHFDLNIAPGVSNFVGKLSTLTMGINGAYLGPVLRAKRGDRVSFSVKNNLTEKTTLHWHGFVLPARMDGGPHQVILPGEAWNPEFDMIQPGATYWYHAHTHELTGQQVYHGLAGLFIVDDDVNLNSSLPVDYGVDDIPVIIQDRKFNRDGTFQYLGSMMDRMQGMKGDTILVNGVVTPILKAKRPLIRLRLLNGSNARIYDLAFHDRRPFIVIASDGGFLAQPDKIRTLRLAPGERAEILLDMSNGSDAILINSPVKESSSRNSNAMMGNMMRMMGNANKAFSIMKIEAPKSANALNS